MQNHLFQNTWFSNLVETKSKFEKITNSSFQNNPKKFKQCTVANWSLFWHKINWPKVEFRPFSSRKSTWPPNLMVGEYVSGILDFISRTLRRQTGQSEYLGGRKRNTNPNEYNNSRQHLWPIVTSRDSWFSSLYIFSLLPRTGCCCRCNRVTNLNIVVKTSPDQVCEKFLSLSKSPTSGGFRDNVATASSCTY